MRLPIPVVVGRTLAREVVRALAAPLHAVLYLARKKAWQRRTRRALARAREPRSEDALAAFLASREHRREGRAHVFVSAGETSGETHACNLVAAVDRAAGDDAPRWSCFGGERLEARGAHLLYPLSGHAVMGLIGVFKSLPFVLRAVATFERLLRDDPPDVVVLVDYPGLHLVLAEAARRRGVPVIHYVAPQYWAWAPWRMRRYRGAVDATLTILPFEPAFFADAGVFSQYIGHPLLDEVALERGDRDAAGDDERPILCILPGSRRNELRSHLPAMVRIARRLRERTPRLRVVLPCRDPQRKGLVGALLAREDASELVELRVGDPGPWLSRCRAALVKSGTGSLEACLHGAPSVVVYVLDHAFARWFLRNLLTVPWFAVANLCMNREIVPELAIKDDGDWDRAEANLLELFEDGERRARCVRDLAELRSILGDPGASRRAARWVLPFCLDHAS